MSCAEKGEDNWISVGVTGGHWKNSVKRIREHASTQYHVSNMVSLKTYLQAKPIDGQLVQQRAEEQSRRQREISHNRQVLVHLLDIIKLLNKISLFEVMSPEIQNQLIGAMADKVLMISIQERFIGMLQVKS